MGKEGIKRKIQWYNCTWDDAKFKGIEGIEEKLVGTYGIFWRSKHGNQLSLALEEIKVK